MTMTAREALAQAAQICRKRAEKRFEELGHTKPDTNASYYGGANEDILEYILESLDEEDEDCALAIEGLRASLPEDQPESAAQAAEAELAKMRVERLHMLSALREYRSAQRMMHRRWAEGDEDVKAFLWRNLHACEEEANMVLEAYEPPAEREEEGQ